VKSIVSAPLLKTLVGRGIPKAVLSYVDADGRTTVVEFDYVKTLSVDTRGYDDATYFGGEVRGLLRPTTSTLTITGQMRTTVKPAASTEKEKPVAKPKLPSVKESADRVRRATVKHAQVTKKLYELEHILTELKGQKLSLDLELKTAREQLLVVAAA
jgi:hypothetical protein